METWKHIPEYTDYYEVSDLGRVRSVERRVMQVSRLGSSYWRTMKGTILRLTEGSSGRYLYAHLANGEKEHHSVHSLVLRAFKGEAPAGTEGCHADGNSMNNVLANLRWGTPASNSEDRRKHGTIPNGEQHGAAILTEEQAIQLKKDIANYPGKKHGRITAVAKEYGVCRAHASDIFHGKRWAHLA